MTSKTRSLSALRSIAHRRAPTARASPAAVSPGHPDLTRSRRGSGTVDVGRHLEHVVALEARRAEARDERG